MVKLQPTKRRLYKLLAKEDGQLIIQAVVTGVVIAILSIGAFYLITSLFNNNTTSEEVVTENNAIDHARGFVASQIGLFPADGFLGVDATSGSLSKISLSGDQLYFKLNSGGTECSVVYYDASSQSLNFIRGNGSSDCYNIEPQQGPNQPGAASSYNGLKECSSTSTAGPCINTLAGGIINGQNNQSVQPIFTYLDSQGNPFGDWFADNLNNQIDYIQNGQVTSYGTADGLSNASQIESLTLGSDGNLWFTEYGTDKIGELCLVSSTGCTQGQISEDPLPAGSKPLGITSSDGNLWFTEYGTDKIGELCLVTSTGCPTAGTINDYSLAAGSQPYAITSTPNGDIWFTEHSGKIGVLEPDNGDAITESSTFSGETPEALIAGPDGKLWFTLAGSNNSVGGVAADPAALSSVASSTLASLPGTPGGIAYDSLGNIWVSAGDYLVELDSSGSVSKTVTEPSSEPICSLAPGSDGEIWFTTCGGSGTKSGEYDPGDDSFSGLTSLGSVGGSGALAGVNSLAIGGPDAMANTNTTNGWYEDNANPSDIKAIEITLVIQASDTNSNSVQTRRFIIALPGSGGAGPSYPPYNTVAPTIISSPVPPSLGASVTLQSPGSWQAPSGDTLTYTYQWEDCATSSVSSCVAIRNATSPSYTLTSPPVNSNDYIRLLVTASTTDGGSSSAYSTTLQVQ